MLHQKPMIIICVLIVCLFLTGCISQPGNQTSFTKIPKTPPTIGPLGTTCPPANETPYIIINPISTHIVGDVFEINGTTNLGVNDRLMIAINEERPTAVGPFDNPEVYHKFIDSLDYVIMNRDNCGINSWSYQVNLTGFHSRTVYDVKVYSEQNRTIINYSNFFIRRDG